VSSSPGVDWHRLCTHNHLAGMRMEKANWYSFHGSVTWRHNRTCSFPWDIIVSPIQIPFNFYHIPIPRRYATTCNPLSHISVDGVYQ
jgi:hypothetical protein